MTVSDFVLAFVSIIIGLGVTDLLVSLHNLLRAGSRVKWHWLAPAFAALMLLMTVLFWWWSYGWYSDVKTATAASFIPRFLFLCACFLMIAAALPDHVPEEGIDLRKFYFDSRIHVWSLFSISVALALAIDAADHWLPATGKFAGVPWKAASALILAVIAASSKRVWVHAFAIGWIFFVVALPNAFTAVGG